MISSASCWKIQNKLIISYHFPHLKNTSLNFIIFLTVQLWKEKKKLKKRGERSHINEKNWKYMMVIAVILSVIIIIIIIVDNRCP
jgi:hypothetical protein